MRKVRKDALKAELAVPKKRGRKPKAKAEKPGLEGVEDKDEDELSMENAIHEQDKQFKAERDTEDFEEGKDGKGGAKGARRTKRRPKKTQTEEIEEEQETPAPEKPSKRRRTTAPQPKESNIN